MPKPDRVHIPYDPEARAGETGWLWDAETNGWCLVTTIEDGPHAGPSLLFHDTGTGGTLMAIGQDFAGRPWMPCQPPAVEPGIDDGALVVCHIGGGATMSHSFPPGADARAALDAVRDALLAQSGAQTLTEGGIR